MVSSGSSLDPDRKLGEFEQVWATRKKIIAELKSVDESLKSLNEEKPE